MGYRFHGLELGDVGVREHCNLWKIITLHRLNQKWTDLASLHVLEVHTYL